MSLTPTCRSLPKHVGSKAAKRVQGRSKVNLRLNVDPVCIVRPAEILKSLIYVIAREVMANTGLKLRKGGQLICHHEIKLLAGETTIL